MSATQARWPQALRACAAGTVGAVMVVMGAGSALAQTAPAPLTNAAPVAGTDVVTGGAPATPITLVEYLQLVQRNSPTLRAEGRLVDAARADVVTARTLPNPRLAYTHKRGERELGLEQPLPIFGQIGARVAGAELGVRSAVAQVQSSSSDYLANAARDFIHLLVAQQRMDLRLAVQAEMNKAAYIVQGQVKAGARSRYDLARIELQQAQMEVELSQAQAALDEAISKVALGAALPRWKPRALGSLQVSGSKAGAVDFDFETLWEQAQKRLPSVRAALANEAQAKQRISLEKREALPTPSIGVSRVRNDTEGRYNVIGVSVDLPLFDRRQGSIARAEAEYMQAQSQREAAEIEAQSLLRLALNQLEHKRALVQRFEVEGMARLNSLRTMAQDSYLLGKSTVLELMDSIESTSERQSAHLDWVQDMLLAEWDVRVASGDVLPEGVVGAALPAR